MATKEKGSGARHRAGKDTHGSGERRRVTNKFFAPKPFAWQAIGVRGLKTMGGAVNEEWRNALRDRTKRMNIYIEMRNDITIRTLLNAMKLPLQKAIIGTEPASENTPADQLAADWLLEAMNKMDRQVWLSHVIDCLDSIDFGFAIGEIVLEKRSDGRMWLKNIDPRGQETLSGWEWDAEDPDIAVTFKQRDPNTRKIYDIPLSRCVHVTYAGRKGNPEGQSMLDVLFEPYRFLKNFKTLEAIGVERDVGGMPVAEIPEEGEISDEDDADLKAALKGMRNDEAMFLITPPGVKITGYGGGSKMYDVGAIIERYEQEILGLSHAQFLKLGMQNVGTQALVKGSQDFFMLGLGSVQEFILEAWNLQLVPYLFRFNNFSGITGLPKITWEPPGKLDVEALLNALSTAAGVNVYTPTDIDEEHIREVLDMPELPEDEKGEPRDIEEPAMPGLFDIKKKLDRIERANSDILQRTVRNNA